MVKSRIGWDCEEIETVLHCSQKCKLVCFIEDILAVPIIILNDPIF